MVARIIFSKVGRVTRAAALALVLALAAAAAGCGGGAGAAGDRLDVVATTTQAADLARNVGGARVRVTGLIPPNADPHAYELRPSDVKALAGADLVVRSGGDLDAWLQDAIESAGSGAPVVTLIDHVRRRGDDPHWWQDPRNAVPAVGAIRAALAKADPGGARAYAARARAYGERLRRLDAAVARCIGGVPASRRKLVTTHDALGYYARRYGLEVIGTVIPSLSTQAQPSAGDVSRLIATIRREHVRAVFAESSVNPKVEQAVGEATGAAIGRPLWADSLGPPGSDGATYVASIRANTAAIVAGLTGGAQSCALPR
jgi:ABC-type Zn uptake system ZnuABC Zn-binding protein ZnuA